MWCSTGCVCFVQEPTAITAMELSTKQVKKLFSHVIICTKVVDKVASPRETKKGNWWAFKETLVSKNKYI